MNNRHQPGTAEMHGEEEISVTDFMRRVWRHRKGLSVILGGIAVLYTIGALASVVFTPSVHVFRLKFRLEFRGAEVGKYPNGTVFSSTDILSAPVLTAVFDRNELGRFCTMEEFTESLVIAQTSDTFESLEREYQARLSDPKLSPVDRQRLEQEFSDKRQSIAQSGYSIAMSTEGGLRHLPRSLEEKILRDILSIWAEWTIRNKGVQLYEIPVLTSQVFGRDLLEEYDYFTLVDLIRIKAERVSENLDRLLELPGSSLAKSSIGKKSLAELRLQIVTVRDSRIRPILGLILTRGISADPGTSLTYLRTQVQFKNIEKLEAEARVAAIRSSLRAYVEEEQRQSTSSASSPIGPENSTVIPQIDESFLNRLIQMTNQGSDLLYRQRMVDDLRTEAMKVIPIESDVRFYQSCLDILPESSRTPTEAEIKIISNQISKIAAELGEITDQMNDIYATLSKDLNPSSVMYSAVAPASFEIERSVSAKRLLLLGLFILAGSIPVLTVGALVYDRMQAEDGKDSYANIDPGT